MRLSCLLAAIAISPALATFVIQCTSRLIDERADPILKPGQIASHAHVIAGGNGFDFEMDYAKAQSSSCSTCYVKEDLSNYWTPKLYYQGQDGNFTSVPVDGDDSQGNMGGMAIYYLPRAGPDNDNLVPFPKGFRMFAGDIMKRVDTLDFAGQAVRHRCVGGTGETTSFPNKVCPQGVRTQIVFPSCWDGVNLDSPDHKSHMSYPKDGNYDGGRCPSTHPVHFLTLFFEVTYRTDQFKWWSDKQPFVLSNGDPTGYSYHGDFINGWNVDKLAEAIEKCPDGSRACDLNGGVFTFFTPTERQACKLPSRVPETVSGILNQLPGCNPVTLEPSEMANCPRNPPIMRNVADASITDLTSKKGWKYLGCGLDDPIAWGSHALTGAQKNIAAMTIGKCIDACSSSGFAYAGLEYSSECYCGNTLNPLAVPKPGVLGNCNMKCAGDPLSNCGGGKAISLYQKCPTGSCANDGDTSLGPIILPTGPLSTNFSSSSPSILAETSSSSGSLASSSSSKLTLSPLSSTTASSPSINKPIKAPVAKTSTSSTVDKTENKPIKTPSPITSPSIPDDCDDEGEEEGDNEDEENNNCDETPNNPTVSKPLSTPTSTLNDALTDPLVKTTFATVKKPVITSSAILTPVKTAV